MFYKEINSDSTYLKFLKNIIYEQKSLIIKQEQLRKFYQLSGQSIKLILRFEKILRYVATLFGIILNITSTYLFDYSIIKSILWNLMFMIVILHLFSYYFAGAIIIYTLTLYINQSFRQIEKEFKMISGN